MLANEVGKTTNLFRKLAVIFTMMAGLSLKPEEAC
jgi:hypothetical protein